MILENDLKEFIKMMIHDEKGIKKMKLSAMTRATPRQIQMECDRRGWDVQIPLKDRRKEDLSKLLFTPGSADDTF